MYFHCSLNSLLCLQQHIPLLCGHDCISSSVLCHHTLCGYFILFAFHGTTGSRKLEQHNLPINWKQAGARTPQLPPPSSSALGLSEGLGPSAGVGRVSAVPKSLPSCAVLVQHLGISWLFLSSSAPAEPAWVVISGDAQLFSSARSRGLEGVELFLLPTSYFLEFPSIFHRLVEEGKSLRILSLFSFSWEVWILLLAHRSKFWKQMLSLIFGVGPSVRDKKGNGW